MTERQPRQSRNIFDGDQLSCLLPEGFLKLIVVGYLDRNIKLLQCLIRISAGWFHLLLDALCQHNQLAWLRKPVAGSLLSQLLFLKQTRDGKPPQNIPDTFLAQPRLCQLYWHGRILSVEKVLVILVWANHTNLLAVLYPATCNPLSLCWKMEMECCSPTSLWHECLWA